MKKTYFEPYKRIVRILAMLIVILLESVIFRWTWDRYYSEGLWLEPFYNKGNSIIVLVYIGLFVLFMYVYGGWKIGQLKTTNVVLSQALSGLCANIFMYFLIVLLSRHLVAIWPMVVMTLAEVALITVFTWVFNIFYTYIFPPRKLVLIYEEYPAEPLLEKMTARSEKYRIVKKMSIDVGLEELERAILKSDGVVLSDLHSEVRNRLLKFCYANSVRVYLTPKISDILIRSSEMLHLFDTPLLLSRNYGLTIEQRFGKRCLDLVILIPVLIIGIPFMLLTALAVKLYDRGPVIYKQERLTLEGKTFYLYKFRSMVVDAEKDGVARLAKQGDRRITPVGKFIRATRLDELPQLFNILKGDMSFVGPRPERPSIAKDYEEAIPEFVYRLKVKAGLTGYAQLYGKYNTTAYDKLKLDLMYIQGYSMLLDLKLIVMTVKILFMKDSTEGLSDEPVTAKPYFQQGVKERNQNE